MMMMTMEGLKKPHQNSLNNLDSEEACIFWRLSLAARRLGVHSIPLSRHTGMGRGISRNDAPWGAECGRQISPMHAGHSKCPKAVAEFPAMSQNAHLLRRRNTR